MAVPVADSIILMFFLLRPHRGCWRDNSIRKASTILLSCEKVSKGLRRRPSRPTHHLVDVDQDARLCVLRGQDVAVDGHPPALVPSDVRVPVQAVDNRRQLGAQQEDVHPAVVRDVVEGVHDRLLQRPGEEVRNHVAVDVDGGAALRSGQLKRPRAGQRDIALTRERGVSFRMVSRAR